MSLPGMRLGRKIYFSSRNSENEIGSATVVLEISLLISMPVPVSAERRPHSSGGKVCMSVGIEGIHEKSPAERVAETLDGRSDFGLNQKANNRNEKVNEGQASGLCRVGHGRPTS